MGELIPFVVQDVVPGDTLHLSQSSMMRFIPMIAPVMHKVNVSMHYFFVPLRILWPDFTKWMAGEEDLERPFHYWSAGLDDSNRSLGDYLGLPTGDTGTTSYIHEVDAYFTAAYYKIWDEYFRDQNLQDEVFQELVAGHNDYYSGRALLPPLRRAWQRDYFTSALPFAQAGDDVLIPLNRTTDLSDVRVLTVPDGAPDLEGGNLRSILQDGVPVLANGEDARVMLDNNANAETINSLRRAFRLQEFLEKTARGGKRYIELMFSHFGVKSSDARLQRPEYLGAHYGAMSISEVLSTVESTAGPLGTMGGHGIGVQRGGNISCYAEEHGIIMGLVSVQPTTAYQQGFQKKFLRKSRFDFYWPSFANLGEQPVENREVFGNQPATEEAGLGTFGYVPRYSEYKFEQSRVSGAFKNSLAFWHMGRIFDSPPALNAEFIECTPTTRAFAVEDSDSEILCHIQNNVKAVRPMPVFGVPTI